MGVNDKEEESNEITLDEENFDNSFSMFIESLKKEIKKPYYWDWVVLELIKRFGSYRYKSLFFKNYFLSDSEEKKNISKELATIWKEEILDTPMFEEGYDDIYRKEIVNLKPFKISKKAWEKIVVSVDLCYWPNCTLKKE